MRENFRVALTMLALACLVIPGVLAAYDYDSDEADVVLRITDEIDLTIHAEVRSRFEWNDNLTDFTDDADDEFGFVPSRARLGFGLTLPRDVDVYVEAQELWSFGEDTPARFTEAARQMPGSAPVSGNVNTTTHRDDLDLYQAYITANNIGDSNFSVRVGRQEMPFGNEWMIGDNDFYGGMSFDALHGWWNFDRGDLHLFWSKIDENNTGAQGGALGPIVNASDDDRDLYGAYYVHPEIGTSLIGFDLYGIAFLDHTDTLANGEAYWIGTRFYRQPEWGFHFNAEATYLFGNNDAANYGGADVDLQSWGFEGHAGYTFDVTGNPDIHGGITWATGDDDPTDSDNETFFAPFPDPHGRLGFADLVVASNLIAYQIGYAGSWENLAWGVELYNFEMDEAPAGTDDSIAQEVDLWFNYQYSRNLSLQIAYAFFSVDDAIEDAVRAGGASPDDGQRFYVNLRLLL